MDFDTPRIRLGSATPSDGSFATATTLEDDLSDIFSSQLSLEPEPESDIHVADSSPEVALPVPDSLDIGNLSLFPEPAPTLPLVIPTLEINNHDISSKAHPQVEPIVTPTVVEEAKLRTVVIFQDACTKHRYSRNSDIGTIVERPERIRAIKTGVATAWARLEARTISKGGSRWDGKKKNVGESSLQGLDELMMGLGLDAKGKGKEVIGGPFDILFSNVVMPVDDPALVYIHPLPNLPPDNPVSDQSLPVPSTSNISSPTSNAPSTPSKRGSSSPPVDITQPGPSAKYCPTSATPSPWPVQLQSLCRAASSAMLSAPYSEIPPHLPQGDLYLTEGSEEAIFGALGAVCEGVDRVVRGAGDSEGYDRAFVAIRPPGHVRLCCTLMKEFLSSLTTCVLYNSIVQKISRWAFAS